MYETNSINTKNSQLSIVLAVLAMIVLFFGLFSGPLSKGFPESSVYSNAEIRFSNVAGVRVADYAIKKNDNSFLIAPKSPKELRLNIEFAHAGRYSALIQAQYPHWLCKPDEINKAVLDIKGGSANERVRLVNGETRRVLFFISEAQNLEFSLLNRKNDDCGRAVVTFLKKNNTLYFKAGFLVFWSLLLLFCVLNRTSPYIAVMGLFVNSLLIASDASLGAIKTSDLIVSSGISLLAVSALSIFAAVPRSRLATLFITIIALCLCIVPMGFIAYAQVFQIPMTDEAIHGAMQSYDSQMIEFWQQYVGKKRTLYMIIGFAALFFAVRHVNKQSTKLRTAASFSALSLLAGLAIVNDRLHQSRTTNLLTASIVKYKWEIDAFKKIADNRKNVAIKGARAAEHAGDTTVIVIGESVNKKFMSAYGYIQNTTPNLDKRIAANEIVLYKNAYSNHTHSNPTMSLILTQANQYNEGKWLESPSVFNFAKAASVETQWLTNHRLLGGWSNQITTIIREADRLETINFKIGYGSDSSNYDHDLIPLYKEAIAERPNQLTFLHLYNSHLFYCNRYPPSSKKFPSKLSPATFGKMGELRKTSEGLLGCYVNTIHYTDAVLEELIIELEQKNSPSVLLYVTDHAEEPIDQRTHNSAQFTFDMINIPLFVWANKAWQEKHADKWKAIQRNKHKIITNDLIFESILGISGIESPEINTTRDISSESYQSLSNPLTLHGRTRINDPENWNYWQSINSAKALKENIDMVAANIESTGQALSALSYGIQHLNVNLKYSASDQFQLVSHQNSTEIMKFEDFLSRLSSGSDLSLKATLVAYKPAELESAENEIKRLAEKYSTLIEIISDKPKDVAPLFSPHFVKSREIDTDKNTWVSFKSRYTDGPPEPKRSH